MPRYRLALVASVVVSALAVMAIGAASEVAADVTVPAAQRPAVGVPSSASDRTVDEWTQRCLSTERHAGGNVVTVTGALRTYRQHEVADGTTYDLRGASIVGYPSANLYPFAFGKHNPGKSTCVLGGTLVGGQSEYLSQQAMKASLDGDGLNLKSQGGVIDGLRVDNVADGIGILGGDPEGVLIRNVHMSYIRDDCIENDFVVGLVVKDSLLDGCFFGLSQRPVADASPPVPPQAERTLLDGVLLRLQPMPYQASQARCAADGLGTGGFFKWSPYASKLVVRNTILMAERLAARCAGAMHIPIDGTFENVMLVWLGPGNYPGALPASGVTVTRDRSVWDNAKAAWLHRHGQTSLGDTDGR